MQQRSRLGRSGPTWYAGEFKGGRRSGKGLGLWLSEDGFQEGLYEGEWLQVHSFSSRGLLSLMHPPLLPVSQGKRHGTGSHRFHNSVDEYEGQWASDQMHGHGVIMRGDGFSFDGMFALGLPHGQGMMMTTVCGLCAGFVF